MFNFIRKLIKADRQESWLSQARQSTFAFPTSCGAEAQMLLAENELLSFSLDADVSVDAGKIANDWIDSKPVNIRENNSYSCTVDFLLLPTPDAEMPVIELDEPAFASAQRYIAVQVPPVADMQRRTDGLIRRVDSQLLSLVGRMSKLPHGLSVAIDVLGAVNDQNKAFLLEMNDELRVFLSVNLPKAEQELRSSCAMLADGGDILHSKASLLGRVRRGAYSVARLKREVVRRQYAIKVFQWLGSRLLFLAYQLRTVQCLFEYLRQQNNLRMASLICPSLALKERTQVATSPLASRSVSCSAVLSLASDGCLLSLASLQPVDLRAQLQALALKLLGRPLLQVEASEQGAQAQDQVHNPEHDPEQEPQATAPQPSQATGTTTA